MPDNRDPNIANSGQQYSAGGGIGGRTGGRLNGPDGGMGGSGRSEPSSGQPTPVNNRDVASQNPGKESERRPNQQHWGNSGQL